MKKINAKFKSNCHETGKVISKGEIMLYNYDTRTCYCMTSKKAENYEEGQSDLEEFYKFNGVKDIDKAIDNIIKQYKETLYCIDFKFSEEEGEFDQFTIYKN